MIEEQMKKDAMRQEILDRYWDDAPDYGNYGGPTDHDNKPVIGLKSDLEFAF